MIILRSKGIEPTRNKVRSFQMQSKIERRCFQGLDRHPRGYKVADLKAETKSIPLNEIDLTCASMVCEPEELDCNVTGGCFLQNGDIILVDHNHSQLLY